ncbi:MAG: AIPR family protein [Cyanobacteria bacterium P01_A01_bin.80]
MTQSVDFEAFLKEWLKEITEGNPSTVKLGNRFSRKLITQWLEVDESTDDIVYCDGTGDGGIDIAYLNQGENLDETSEEGDVWYLVQSKYGKAFSGSRTLLAEAQKVIDTLDGKQKKLSSLAQDLLERLLNFRAQASKRDKLILVFATEESLTDTQIQVLEDIKVLGKSRIGKIFDVEAVSIATIHQRIIDLPLTQIKIPLKVNDARGDRLIVGSLKLKELYSFMKEYRNQKGDLDQLYEKNVRRFLGKQRKVNKAIKETLEQEPENFGLYNNGVTIVVQDFEKASRGFELVEPYIVNGCQTSKTIWNVLQSRLDSGGTGSSSKLKEWKDKLEEGVVIIKIVKVGSGGQDLLTRITRYTNSQNAVTEKDFIALTSDFRTWQKDIANKYDLFLEIQRGGWDSQKALQKQNNSKHYFEKWANAFALFKVYGAGWLREAGMAYGTNQPFLPNGSIFKKITNNQENGESFGIDDLYAAYRLQATANERYKFGGKEIESRKFTRFLFYMVVIELLKSVMIDTKIKISNTEITQVFLKLFHKNNQLACDALFEQAIQLIDEYMKPEEPDSVYYEPEVVSKSKDVKSYLRWDKLGKTKEFSPKLYDLLALHQRLMKRRNGNQKSPFSLILQAIKKE